MGKRRIYNELLIKGINPNYQEALNFLDEERERETAISLVKKKNENI